LPRTTPLLSTRSNRGRGTINSYLLRKDNIKYASPSDQ
jgi:hypothetical protein